MTEYIILNTDNNHHICDTCYTQKDTVISETSTHYTYCNKCNNNKEIVFKQLLFDSILKSINSYLNVTNISNNFEILIDILCEDNCIFTRINNILISKKECNFKLSSKDKVFLKNTIGYVIEDTLSIDASLISINISF